MLRAELVGAPGVERALVGGVLRGGAREGICLSRGRGGKVGEGGRGGGKEEWEGAVYRTLSGTAPL